MLNVMSGPNAPLCKAFRFCGWLAEPVDYLICDDQDVADPEFQKVFHAKLKHADFLAAALDCSTKSRAREIPRSFPDGNEMPKPLRTDEHPMDVPGLKGYDKQRVDRDNKRVSLFWQSVHS